MNTEPDFVPPTAAISQVGRLEVPGLAYQQHGVVARWQLLDLGLSRHRIQKLIEQRRLHPVRRGVYAVGHARLTREGHWMAAVLACGRVAFLSHRTAATHWGMLRSSSPRVHVTVAATGRAERDGIVLHESADIAEHATTRDAIPVTTVARTLLDLAADDDPLLPRAIEEAEHLRLFDLKPIEALLATPRPGVRRLRAELAIYTVTPEWDRSRFERRVLQAIRAAGLPEPALNVWVLGAERDLAWADYGLIVELDGPWHRGTAARVRDPQRDATLQLHEWKVIRVAQEWFDTDPAGVIATIREFLSRGERTRARPGR